MKKEKKCSHEVEFLGEQRGMKGSNKYYRCKRCGIVLVFSEDGTLYEISHRGRANRKIYRQLS